MNALDGLTGYYKGFQFHFVKTKVLGSHNGIYLSGVIFYLDLTFLMTNRTYFSGVVALKAKIIGWISGAGN